jgi:dicarboxylate transporter 10
MTSDLTRQPEKRFGYSNAFRGLVEIMKTEGARGLTTGLATNTVR